MTAHGACPAAAMPVIGYLGSETSGRFTGRLLRVRRERPCSRRAADKRHELASFHSITQPRTRLRLSSPGQQNAPGRT
jgi:hypothetical protein